MGERIRQKTVGEGLKPPLLALEREEGGHEPRNVRGPYKSEKVKRQISPWSLQKGTLPS